MLNQAAFRLLAETRRVAFTTTGTFCSHLGQVAGCLFISWNRVMQPAQVCLAPRVVVIRNLESLHSRNIEWKPPAYTLTAAIDMIIYMKYLNILFPAYPI